MSALAHRMVEKKQPRLVVISNEEDVSSVARSQLRKRFELGGDSTSTTQPNVLRPVEDRKTMRPKPEEVRELISSTTAPPSQNSRPTIPTPRPRLALNAVPRRLVDARQMMALPLDHRAAFVLTNIDGKTPIRSLIDVTGMAAEEVLVLVERLVELKAVAIF